MNESRTPSDSIFASPWFYFVVALGWSWLCWLTVITLGFSMESAQGFILAMLGLLGPLIGGLVGTYSTYGKQGRRDFWRRVIDVRRIPGRWYAVIFLFTPVLFVISVALDLLSGGAGGYWEEPALKMIENPLYFFPFALSIFLVGPMEEFGWRGYALNRLQEERWNALNSGLIVGVFWSLWHLPLFFMEGTYQHNLGAGSLPFWMFMVGIVPLSIVFTWIFNNTGRSTLGAMLFHFAVNFTGQCYEFTDLGEIYSYVLWIAGAIAVVAIWGSGTMSKRDPYARFEGSEDKVAENARQR